jgi:hypothetical protein
MGAVGSKGKMAMIRTTGQGRLVIQEGQVNAKRDSPNSVTMWFDLHGDEAVAEARKMVATMRGRGDLDGADSWLRIIVALEEMRQVNSRSLS